MFAVATLCIVLVSASTCLCGKTLNLSVSTVTFKYHLLAKNNPTVSEARFKEWVNQNLTRHVNTNGTNVLFIQGLFEKNNVSYINRVLEEHTELTLVPDCEISTVQTVDLDRNEGGGNWVTPTPIFANQSWNVKCLVHTDSSTFATFTVTSGSKEYKILLINVFLMSKPFTTSMVFRVFTFNHEPKINWNHDRLKTVNEGIYCLKMECEKWRIEEFKKAVKSGYKNFTADLIILGGRLNTITSGEINTHSPHNWGRREMLLHDLYRSKWVITETLAKDSFKDAYRQIYTDRAKDRGYTYMYNCRVNGCRLRNDWHRIDYIYYRNTSARVTANSANLVPVQFPNDGKLYGYNNSILSAQLSVDFPPFGVRSTPTTSSSAAPNTKAQLNTTAISASTAISHSKSTPSGEGWGGLSPNIVMGIVLGILSVVAIVFLVSYCYWTRSMTGQSVERTLQGDSLHPTQVGHTTAGRSRHPTESGKTTTGTSRQSTLVGNTTGSKTRSMVPSGRSGRIDSDVYTQTSKIATSKHRSHTNNDYSRPATSQGSEAQTTVTGRTRSRISRRNESASKRSAASTHGSVPSRR